MPSPTPTYITGTPSSRVMGKMTPPLAVPSSLVSTTPLMRAAKLGRIELIDPLLAHGARVDVLNQDGCNALWLACYHGDPALVRKLVAVGAPIDQQNGNGASCLMYVSSNGKAELVEVLLELGADPTLKNFDDWTALDLAASPGCLRALRKLRP